MSTESPILFEKDPLVLSARIADYRYRVHNREDTTQKATRQRGACSIQSKHKRGFEQSFHPEIIGHVCGWF